ncbi:prephenate dehydrogenase (NADP(+)) [Tulasnella sp. JGI-2019a]|nr:prephenate dehydrogenase (NADP(+)) [Tulasnella sp. JGI-2019a]KAG9005162.1 prephenate dehydrogenase (NADP(+)) [Tulasnella sp. JGI-2019a]
MDHQRWKDVSPDSPEQQQPVIGIIGMGDMGRMYARRLSAAGWMKIYVCDRPEKYKTLTEDMRGFPGVTVLKDGHLVSRSSDFIMYAVEAEFIGKVVAQYGASTKVGAIVSGQTSVKDPERQAFEKHLPPDVYIVSVHSLHGPAISTEGQPLVNHSLLAVMRIILIP